jgi:hypothetical protein
MIWAGNIDKWSSRVSCGPGVPHTEQGARASWRLSPQLQARIPGGAVFELRPTDGGRFELL